MIAYLVGACCNYQNAAWRKTKSKSLPERGTQWHGTRKQQRYKVDIFDEGAMIAVAVPTSIRMGVFCKKWIQVVTTASSCQCQGDLVSFTCGLINKFLPGGGYWHGAHNTICTTYLFIGDMHSRYRLPSRQRRWGLSYSVKQAFNIM